eukprot:TRINITY_DN52575_c0_g1_i1.p1 TRINITY_DN52575_c0_g1~~TRINITY_DN52575_c0_g1_i1.p1  ORF type:complete len:118 (+),score=12.26 TRINITY_DN52575_c0_g1_i1:37-354(+)
MAGNGNGKGYGSKGNDKAKPLSQSFFGTPMDVPSSKLAPTTASVSSEPAVTRTAHASSRMAALATTGNSSRCSLCSLVPCRCQNVAVFKSMGSVSCDNLGVALAK